MKRVIEFLLIISVVAIITEISFAKREHLEKWYQEKWCNSHDGTMEVVLEDGSRCDCLTSDYAVEFDFASKWAESIGQALLYSAYTGKRAGIVLIMENPEKDEIFINRINKVIESHDLPIKVWSIKSRRDLNEKN